MTSNLGRKPASWSNENSIFHSKSSPQYLYRLLFLMLNAWSLGCREHFPPLCTWRALYGGVCSWLVCGQFCSTECDPVDSVMVHKTCQGKSIPFPALSKPRVTQQLSTCRCLHTEVSTVEYLSLCCCHIQHKMTLSLPKLKYSLNFFLAIFKNARQKLLWKLFSC